MPTSSIKLTDSIIICQFQLDIFKKAIRNYMNKCKLKGDDLLLPSYTKEEEIKRMKRRGVFKERQIESTTENIEVFTVPENQLRREPRAEQPIQQTGEYVEHIETHEEQLSDLTAAQQPLRRRVLPTRNPVINLEQNVVTEENGDNISEELERLQSPLRFNEDLNNEYTEDDITNLNGDNISEELVRQQSPLRFNEDINNEYSEDDIANLNEAVLSILMLLWMILYQ